jgi:hypothetical protein
MTNFSDYDRQKNLSFAQGKARPVTLCGRYQFPFNLIRVGVLGISWFIISVLMFAETNIQL